MKTLFLRGLQAVMLMSLCLLAVQAQTTGSIAGAVADQSGAIVPGATVTVKGEAGQEYTAVTSSNGTYNIPGIQAGF